MNPRFPLPTLIDLTEKRRRRKEGKVKDFNFTFFFFGLLVHCPTPLVPIMPNYQSTKKKPISKTTNSTLSLSLYLSYLYRESQTQSDRVTKPKSPKKKKKTPQAAAQIQFTISQSPTSV